jgi:acyl-CoA thioesterase FadM
MPTAILPVQVRFGDLDPLNHVNNVAYFSLMEAARVDFFRTHVRALFGHMVIARSECDYLGEIRGGTRTVDVTISIEKVGRSSFVVLHEIRDGDRLAAVGRTVQVVLGEDRRSRPLTDEERTLLLQD